MKGDLTDVGAWEKTWKKSAVQVHRSHQRSLHDEAFAAFMEHAPSAPPLEVLEIGCAPGKKLRDMATFAPSHHYSGIDFAPKALADTERHLRNVGVDATLHLADVRTFEPGKRYDLVFSVGLIEHFDDPSDIVAHHARLTRACGTVAVIIPNYRHPVLKRALALYSPDTLATHNLEAMTIDALEGFMRNTGLTDIRSGEYGGALAPTGRARSGSLGLVARYAAAAWNLAQRPMPKSWQPWQGFLWVCARKPAI